jgi:thioesterase domain-containing protein
MAAGYRAAVQGVQPAGPYLLAGFSFGGIVAFEMARQLTAAEEEVALLALLDAAVPAGEEPQDFDAAEVIVDLLRDNIQAVQAPLALEADALRGLPLDGQLARAQEILGDVLGGMEALGPGIDLPLVRRLVLGYGSRVAAVERYKVSPYPGKITLVRPREGAPANLRDTESPSLGWQAVAAGGVEIHTVPGSHKTMIEEPNVEALAEILRACIARAAARPSPAHLARGAGHGERRYARKP